MRARVAIDAGTLGRERISPLVAINARAAVRQQIGGVERMAREMAVRLPALRPDRYRVMAPHAALARCRARLGAARATRVGRPLRPRVLASEPRPRDLAA
jgi:hypothetical protein